MLTKFRYLTLIFIAIVAAVSLRPNFVFSETAPTQEIQELNEKIKAQKEKIKQLEETIGKYSKNIKEKQLEAVSLKNQLGILDNRLAQMQADIELTQSRIGETELEIRSLQISIQSKERDMGRQKEIISKMVQSIHANDQKNALEILLTNNDFADFYNQLQYLENVYSDLGRSVKTLRLAKEELDGKKAEVVKRQKTYEELEAQLKEKKQDLDEQRGNKQQLLADTRYSEQKFRTLQDSLKRQYQAEENEVRNYEAQVRKKLAEQEKIQATGDVNFSWPTNGRYITAQFHDATYPFRKVFEHSAIDIRASQGTPVRAAAAGYVGRARRCTTASCYAYVLLIHTGNLSTVYGHLSSIAVGDDQFVNRGDIIGYSGAAPGTVGAGPFTTGAHLHFEVRANGIPVDPLGYLP